MKRRTDQRRRRTLQSETYDSRRRTLQYKNTSRQFQEALKRFVVIALALAVLMWLLFFGRLSTKIEYNGEYQGDVQATAEHFFEQTSSWRLSFEAESLERYMLRELPLFESFSIRTSPFSKRVIVEGKIKPSAVLWQSAGRTYGLDADGFVVSDAVEMSENLPIVFDGAQLQYEVGQRLVTRDFIAFVVSLRRIEASFKKLGITDYKAEGSIQSLTLATSKGFDIRLSTEIKPSAQLETAQDLLGEGVAPQEYIDTRIAGRAYWR